MPSKAPSRDGRKLDHKTLEEIRVRAVQRVQEGESPEVVIAALGMSRTCNLQVAGCLSRAEMDGLRAKRLRVSGSRSAMTEASVRGVSAEPRLGRSVVGAGVSGDSRTGSPGQGGDLLRRRGWRALGFP